MSKPLDEETLRDAKDDLLERIADQRKLMGRLPDTAVAEKFIEPILHKVDVDHEVERQRVLVRAEAGIADGGDGKVLPTGRVRRRRSPAAPVAGLSEAVVYRKPVDAGELAKEAQLTTLKRMMVKHLMEWPEWRAILTTTGKLCRLHDGVFVPASDTCMDCTMRERRLGLIMDQAVKHFGDPRRPAEPKAFSLPRSNPFTRRAVVTESKGSAS